MAEVVIYDVYHPDGYLMCSVNDGGRPGSIRPTNVPGSDFNPALPRWVQRDSYQDVLDENVEQLTLF